MIQSLDLWANANRWHDRVVENGVAAGGWLLMAMLLPPFPGALIVFFIAMTTATVGAGVPGRVVAGAMAVPCVFLAVGVLPLLWSVHPSPDTGLVVEFSRAGLATAVATGLRSLGATSALIFLCVTTPLSAQMGLLRQWHVPDFLLDIMSLTYRLIFLFDDVLERRITAQAGRLGYRDFRTGFRSVSLVVASLFVHTLARAQAMERGLAGRGYDGTLRVLDRSPRQPQTHRLVGIVTLQGLVVVFSLAWEVFFRG